MSLLEGKLKLDIPSDFSRDPDDPKEPKTIAKFSGPDGAWGTVLRGTHGLTPDQLDGYLKTRVSEYNKGFKWLPKDSHLQWLKKDIVTIDGRKWADWSFVPVTKGRKDYSHNPVYTRNLTTSYKGQLLKFTPDGTSSTFAAGLGIPQALVFDRAGNLYVSSEEAEITGLHTHILKFALDGSKSTVETAPDPVGLAFDGTGNLFVFDAQSRSILKFTADGTKTTFAWDVSSTSPDKKWEFVGGMEPKILDAATKKVVLEISQGRGGMIWAPDSKRFAFSYRDHGSHGYISESAAFYELRGDKWEELGSLADDVSGGSQLAHLLKKHLPKKFNPRDCSSNSDVLDFREWTDASTAILYAPCYRPDSEKVKAGFLFTLKFDAAGKWKIVKTHQMSEKEVAKIEKGE